MLEDLPDTATLLEAFPDEIWWLPAAVFTLGIAVLLYPFARQRFHQWRLERRLAQSDFMLEWELQEYERAIGDELEPVDWAGKIVLFAGYSLFPLLALWASNAGLDGWWLAGTCAVFIVGAIYSLWRRINDPEGAPITFTGPDAEVPPEAIIGFLGAVFAIGLVTLFAYWV